MKRIVIMVALAVLLLSVAVQAQAPVPKPGPELKKLAVYLGQWKYEAESKAGPLGPADKSTGRATGEMIFRGFFLEWQWKDQGTTSATQGFEFLGYDPVNKNYASSSYADDGSASSGAYVIDGNKSTFSGKLVVGGKKYDWRATEVFAADLMTFTRKEEISVDGKTWIPSYEAKFTKLKTEPRK